MKRRAFLATTAATLLAGCAETEKDVITFDSTHLQYGESVTLHDGWEVTIHEWVTSRSYDTEFTEKTLSGDDVILFVRITSKNTTSDTKSSYVTPSMMAITGVGKETSKITQTIPSESFVLPTGRSLPSYRYNASLYHEGNELYLDNDMYDIPAGTTIEGWHSFSVPQNFNPEDMQILVRDSIEKQVSRFLRRDSIERHVSQYFWSD